MARNKVSGVFVRWPKPIFELITKKNKKYKTYFDGAMTYAHYELSAIDLKKEVVKYIKKIDQKHSLLERIEDMNENRFISVGKYMYILNHGGEIPDNIIPILMSSFEKIVEEEEAKILAEKENTKYISEKDNKIEDTSKIVYSIQDRIKERAREVAGEIEGWLDEFCLDKKSEIKKVEEFVGLYKTFDIKSPHARYIRDFFEYRSNEITEVIEGQNKDLNEAYSNFSKTEIKKLSLFYSNLLKACDMIQEVAKIERAPRKKKPVSQEKIISKLRYKKEDPILGIVSINPIQIIGAKEVWCFNTKTKKITQYKALDANGLTVKGASIVNFSADSAEKTLRKHVDALAAFKQTNKVKLRTFMKDIATVDIHPTGKLNEHHLILRVDK